MTSIPTLTTPRLILRPIELADAEQIQHIFPQWEIIQHLNANAAIPWPYPPDGALIHLREDVLPEMEEGREWHWTIRLKTSPDQILGRISLYDHPEDPDANRGFWLVPECWGQGFMTEACRETMRYWFEVLGKPRMRARKAATNISSRRISEREGMHLVKTQPGSSVNGPRIEELWEITAEEWRQRNGGKAQPPLAESTRDR